jgi:polyferredoxin
MFNGFAAEVFEPVFPLLGKKKYLSSLSLKIFSWLRWLFLLFAFGFTIWWILYISGVSVPGDFTFIAELEIYKYLGTELLAMMFFWVVFSGRGYCYYCPLGTVLSLISRTSGQQIITNRSQCIQCGKCNIACPMSIEIKAPASKGEPVRSLRCVGCGHCIDVCPTQTLEYSTTFLSITKIKAGTQR